LQPGHRRHQRLPPPRSTGTTSPYVLDRFAGRIAGCAHRELRFQRPSPTHLGGLSTALERTYMAKSSTDPYAAKLALYEILVATNPSVQRKGDTMPYTSLNGHMFSLLTKEGTLTLRLPAEARDEFIKKYETKL